ncbi:MAG: hypothetical protein ACPLPW_07835 [bacterium]
MRAIPGIGINPALVILGHPGHFMWLPEEDAYAAYCGLDPTIGNLGIVGPTSGPDEGSADH